MGVVERTSIAAGDSGNSEKRAVCVCTVHTDQPSAVLVVKWYAS
jgi:hypothetical protein